MISDLDASSYKIFFYFICVVVDNGTRDGLDKFLRAASKEPETVVHYEFMQDYKVFETLLFYKPLLLSCIFLGYGCVVIGPFEAFGWSYRRGTVARGH